MNCYFCQSELEMEKSPSGVGRCRSCEKQHALKSCATVYHKDNRLMYAHIYIQKSEIISYTVPSVRFSGGGMAFVQLGYDYHFRLEFDNNQTVLACINGDDWKLITTFPEYPITPQNAHKKLETCLTFS